MNFSCSLATSDPVFCGMEGVGGVVVGRGVPPKKSPPVLKQARFGGAGASPRFFQLTEPCQYDTTGIIQT